MTENCAKSGSCCFTQMLEDHPFLRDLVYWRRPVESAGALILGLSYLISFATLSSISVVAYSCLALLCCTAGWRICTEIMGRRKKDAAGNPVAGETSALEKYLSADFQLPKEKMAKNCADIVMVVQDYLNYVRRVLVFENFVESLVFAAGMYMLARVGQWVNLLTLVTLGYVAMFSLPKVYELYKVQIDQIMAQLMEKLKKLWAIIRDKLSTLPVVGPKLKSS